MPATNWPSEASFSDWVRRSRRAARSASRRVCRVMSRATSTRPSVWAVGAGQRRRRQQEDAVEASSSTRRAGDPPPQPPAASTQSSVSAPTSSRAAAASDRRRAQADPRRERVVRLDDAQLLVHDGDEVDERVERVFEQPPLPQDVVEQLDVLDPDRQLARRAPARSRAIRRRRPGRPVAVHDERAECASPSAQRREHAGAVEDRTVQPERARGEMRLVVDRDPGSGPAAARSGLTPPRSIPSAPVRGRGGRAARRRPAGRQAGPRRQRQVAERLRKRRVDVASRAKARSRSRRPVWNRTSRCSCGRPAVDSKIIGVNILRACSTLVNAGGRPNLPSARKPTRT